MPLSSIEGAAVRVVEKSGQSAVIYLDLDGCFYFKNYYGNTRGNKWEHFFDSEEIIPFELVFPSDDDPNTAEIKKNSRLNEITV